MRFAEVEAELHENGLRVQAGCNSTCNSWLETTHIPLAYQGFGKMGIARLFACKAPANNAQFEAEELDATIRQNPEVLGYDE